MVKVVFKGKKAKLLKIPKAEIKGIKKRIGADEYNKHVGPTLEYYMKRVEGKLVENKMPLDNITTSHATVFELAKWVHKNLEWRVKDDAEKSPIDAIAVLQKGSGNCNDKVGVLVSFLKSVGIPGKYSGISHTRAKIMLPHDDLEVEFFPSNFMITTREGQWEIGRGTEGNPYMHFRDLNDLSGFQFDQHVNVFKKKFKNPMNQFMQEKYCETYKKQHTLWTYDKKRK